MKRESVSGLKHADAPFLYFFSRLANLLLSASNSTGFTDTLKSFLRKNSFLTPNERPKSNSFIVNVICDWPTKTCCAAVVGITVCSSRKLCGTLPAWFALTEPIKHLVRQNTARSLLIFPRTSTEYSNHCESSELSP